MPNQHKAPLIGWHPSPAVLVARLEALVKRRGVRRSVILNEALSQYLEREDTMSTTPGYETGTDPETGQKVVMVGDEWVSEEEAAEYARAEAEALGTLPAPEDFPGVVTDYNGVMMLHLAGDRLSFRSATTETGKTAEGWDWARYDSDGKLEAQDWAETDAEMSGVLAEFAAKRTEGRA